MLHAILSSLHRGFWGGDPFSLVPYKGFTSASPSLHGILRMTQKPDDETRAECID